MVSKGFPNVTTSGRQYNIGEKPSVKKRLIKWSWCTFCEKIQGTDESGTTVRNKRHAAEDSSGQDRMGGYTRWPEAYLVTLTDRCSFLCVSGQRGTIAKSMHEEHLCVVALTSMERGTQFFPLASYRLV